MGWCSNYWKGILLQELHFKNKSSHVEYNPRKILMRQSIHHLNISSKYSSSEYFVNRVESFCQNIHHLNILSMKFIIYMSQNNHHLNILSIELNCFVKIFIIWIFCQSSWSVFKCFILNYSLWWKNISCVVHMDYCRKSDSKA